MKEFNSNKYLEDIRKKIPGYDLMFELIFNSILKIEFPNLKINNTLAIGSNVKEINSLLDTYLVEEIHLIEPSRVMLEMVKEENKNFPNEKKVKYICEKFENYKTDKKYDLCLCSLVLQFVEKPDIFLEKIYRALNIGGKLALSIFSNEQLNYWREFALSRGANKEQVEKTFSNQKEVMNELQVLEIEKILKLIRFKRVEKVFQVFSTVMWIIEK
ncbi:MAG: methyltransferase [Fusobacteriales bacterium]|nr:MAG: methyltransferase [Fusobacteriales bacterium]